MGAASASPEKLAGEPVILQVYDLNMAGGVGPQVNAALMQTMGVGAFHCGVEIYNQEWSFGGGKGPGIFSCRPRENHEHVFRESITMGATTMTRQEVLALIKELREHWPSSEYDLLYRNCCHFSNTLCRQLGVGTIPDYLLSLAETGATVTEPIEYMNARTHSFAGKFKGLFSCGGGGCTGGASPSHLVELLPPRSEIIERGKVARGATKEDPFKLGDFTRGAIRKLSDVPDRPQSRPPPSGSKYRGSVPARS